jgi:transcriptional regulator with XRE-family HTH domain
MEFGNVFKEQRKNAGLSQRQVADVLHIHQSNISDWENNVHRPEYERLIELAKLYEVSLEELLGIEDIL